MNNHEKEYFEDLLVRFSQSAKAENSGLFTDIRRQLQSLPLIQEHLSQQVDIIFEIKEQNKIRNGRIERLEQWKQFVSGGQRGFLAVFIILISLISWVAVREINRVDMVQAQITNLQANQTKLP